MTYIRKSQADGETVLREASIAWPYHLVSWLALIFLGVLLIGIYIFIRLQAWIRTTEFGLTDRKIIFKTGFFARQTHEIPLTSLDEVTIEQGFWGR
ncbi:MAG: PH domain-containing protein, partial [Pseudomonadota bacterium]